MIAPNDIELEGLIIGTVLIRKKLAPFEKSVSVVDFFSMPNQRIWGAILEADEENQPIEILDIVAKVNDPNIKGSTLSQMTFGLPYAEVRYDDVKRLKDLATLRRILHSFRDLAQMASDKAPVLDIIEENQALLDTLKNEQDAREGSSQTIVEVMENEVFPRLDKFVSGEMVKVPFGFEKLDAATNGGASLGELVVFGALPKSGKALALDTRIPTPTGWTTMGEIQVGDQVFDENGNICNVIATTSIMDNRPCYEVEFNNGVKVIADAEHEWKTRTHGRRLSQTNLMKNRSRPDYYKSPLSRDMSHRHVPPDGIVTTEQISQKVRMGDGKVNHSVKVAAPLNLADQELLIPPYVLGAWLGDGTSSCGNITTADLEIAEEIRQSGYHVVKTKTKYVHSIYGLLVQLRELNVLRNKHIPIQYLRGSFEQRLALLQGLMDTDGYCCKKKGICEFTTTKSALAQDVLDLVGSLGINAKVYEGRATLKGRDISPKWRISFQTEMQVFRLERKYSRQALCKFKGAQTWRGIKSVTKIESVPVKCVEVDSPSHLYLITDRYIPTHNSSMMLQIARHIASQNLPTLIVSLEMLNYENGFRFLAQSSRFSVNVFRPDLQDWVADQLKAHAKEHYTIPLFFDQKSRTMKEVKQEVRRLKEQTGLTAAIIDYPQLMRGERKNASRVERIEEVFFDLKELAMKEEIVVYTPAQFNREGIKAERPTLAHFDGSSAIEKTANLGIFWTLETDHDPAVDGRKGKMWIELGRSVANDEFDGLVFHGKDARFSFNDR